MKIFVPVLLLLCIGAASAESPEEKGLAIAIEADRRDSGFGDSVAEMKMTLLNKHGESSTREIRVKTLEQEHEGDKSLVVFDRPPDIKGTALLTFSHATEPDDQWLYLPAIKRVKRISSSNRSGPFMGSEFAFEDMASQEVEKYTYLYLRDEDFDGQACFVVERYPTDPKSGYTRQVTWIDQEHYRTLKTDFYDRKNELLKTFLGLHYTQHLGAYWRAERMEMTNHQTGKSTVLVWSNFSWRNGFTDREFDRNSLARAR